MRSPALGLQRIVSTLSCLMLVLGLGILAGPGCRRNSHGPKATPVLITIACPRNISSSLVIIAHQKGLLARGGDRTTLLPFESGKAAMAHMLAGDADLALVAETPLAAAILADAKIKILATVSQSNRDLSIVARRGQGHSRADLRGKVIGYTQGTGGHFYLDTYCLMNRIDLGGLRLVNLSPLELRSALLDGRVDAVSAWNPHVAFLTEALGPQAAVFQDEVIYTQMFCLVARPEFIRDHPGQVKDLLEGLFLALDFVARSPDEARNQVAAYTQVTPALVAQFFERITWACDWIRRSSSASKTRGVGSWILVRCNGGNCLDMSSYLLPSGPVRKSDPRRSRSSVCMKVAAHEDSNLTPIDLFCVDLHDGRRPGGFSARFQVAGEGQCFRGATHPTPGEHL